MKPPLSAPMRVRLEAEQRRRLEELAEEHETTLSELLRDAVALYLAAIIDTLPTPRRRRPAPTRGA